jgi:hypothetical protein
VTHYPDTRCFFLAPTHRYQVSLRRYVSSEAGDRCCASPIGFHEAVAAIGVEEHAQQPRCNDPDHADRADPRWPRACTHCGRAFADVDAWQVDFEVLHTRSDGGAETTLRAAPPGAMWDATWMPESYRVQGRYLIVRLPNGRDWAIDDEASNCTRKGDESHRCWVRHGEPPNLTVDKNGETCAAGAGSILSGDYHGFLRNGVLTSC